MHIKTSHSLSIVIILSAVDRPPPIITFLILFLGFAMKTIKKKDLEKKDYEKDKLISCVKRQDMEKHCTF